VLAPAGRRPGGGGRRERTLLGESVQSEHDHLHNDGVRQRRLDGRGREQLDVRVVARMVIVRERGAGEVVRVRLGSGGGVVLRRMVMREAVGHLGEEEAQTQKEGEQEARDAGAAQVPHAGKITPDEAAGARLTAEARLNANAPEGAS
jgi:hypothetical protein